MFNENKAGQQLRKLEKHLQQENPILSEVVQNFRELDRISRRLGFFEREQSHATATPWWPLISILGIYSAGKSSFINSLLQYDLQAVGIQAVDDKFSVICFSREKKPRVLPGLALDADPRFPLYRISQAIDEVAEGEHIDAYLQLKTCPSEKLRGKILIDSPGFDADAQRTSTLRITDHIIDLSDLVLVFFDARHPESGSMRDTLEHLVKATINRRDSNKFLYILNQIDVTAKEDNLEEVFAAWQRALAQYGLTAGCSYAIYNLDAAVPFEDQDVRERFEAKRRADMEAINNRIEQVGVERAYRIIGMLEQTARMLKNEVVPLLPCQPGQPGGGRPTSPSEKGTSTSAAQSSAAASGLCPAVGRVIEQAGRRVGQGVSSDLFFQPALDEDDESVDLRRGQRYAGREAMPLVQTSPATGGGGMLGDKHRVPLHGRLPAIPGREGRRQAGSDKIIGVVPDHRQPPGFQVGHLLFGQAKRRPEG